MQHVTIEVKGTVRTTLAVDAQASVDGAELAARLPLGIPALYQRFEVDAGAAIAVSAAPEHEVSAGIHQFKVVFLQEYPLHEGVPTRVEAIAASRADAFSLMKAAEAAGAFSRVEVHNLQGGVEARMVSPRAGFGVVESASGRIVASRLTLSEAQRRFASEIGRTGAVALSLVDFRHVGGRVLARSG